jgi:predicted ribosomally synthesized peptide with SipW-like signal peptide
VSDEGSLALSRRSLLSAIGGVGLAGAGASVGTTALFAEDEEFARNTLAAGNLDLLVGWQQWRHELDLTTGDLTRRPVNAHPDDDGDGVQSYAGREFDVLAGERAVAAPNACCRNGDDAALAVEQDGVVSRVVPFDRDESVEAFYDDGDGGPRSGHEADDACRMLFYRDEVGELYLVVLLDDQASGEESGAEVVEFDFPGGLPESGAWLTELGEGNDAFGPDSVRFQWGGRYNDGGVFGPLEEPFPPILLDPDFTGNAGTDRWEFVSADDPGTPVTLATDELVRLSGHCGVASSGDIPRPAAFRSDAAPEQDALVELTDVMPGDSGEVVFDLRACSSDAYVWLLGTAFAESPGATTEPELEAEGGTDEAVLAENLVLDVRYDVNHAGSWDGDEPRLFGPGFGPYTDGDGSNPATLEAAFEVLGRSSDTAIPLDGDAASPMAWNDGPEAESRQCLSTDDVLSVHVSWSVPASVGNEMQGDSVAFTLGFYAEQCQNNDGGLGID